MLLLDRLNKDHITSPLGITSAIAIVYTTYKTVSNYKDRQRFKNIPVPSPDYPIVGMYKKSRYLAVCFFSLNQSNNIY